jgi:hypothetical protein
MDADTNGPMITDADRLLAVVGQLTTWDFARAFREGLSPAELMQVIAALPTGRLNGLMDQARHAGTEPPQQGHHQRKPLARRSTRRVSKPACRRWSWLQRWASASPA